MMDILGVIPARYGSTRFPGKPLVEIEGKTMIQRVYEQAALCPSVSELVVATDDERILDHVQGFSGNAMMTNVDHQSGTERCFEVLEKSGFNFDGLVNIQGDEPFIQPEQIELLISCLQEPETEIATLVKRIEDFQEYHNNSTVKVVINKNNEALYFSRSPIPYFNQADSEILFREYVLYKHIGIYGYRTETLKKIIQLPASPLEQLESLEQLRWLENGFKIRTKETEIETVAIDKPEDLDQIGSNT